MFKIVLIIFLFLNVFLMLFFVYFKIFLIKTKKENSELNKKINDLLFKNSFYNYQNNYRMVNILSSANNFFCDSTTNLKLSFIIKNINEFSLIKPLLKIDQKKLHLIPFYQYSTDAHERECSRQHLLAWKLPQSRAIWRHTAVAWSCLLQRTEA